LYVRIQAYTHHSSAHVRFSLELYRIWYGLIYISIHYILLYRIDLPSCKLHLEAVLWYWQFVQAPPNSLSTLAMQSGKGPRERLPVQIVQDFVLPCTNIIWPIAALIDCWRFRSSLAVVFSPLSRYSLRVIRRAQSYIMLHININQVTIYLLTCLGRFHNIAYVIVRTLTSPFNDPSS
jgi:hypothetical protein